MKQLAICVVFAGIVFASVGAKFRDLAMGAYPPSSRVSFTTGELDAWINAEIPLAIGPGVRNARVEADSGDIIRGYLDVDFLKVRQAKGDKPNWLMSELLSGERPVEMTVRITSAHGKMRVDVLRVSVSGVVAEGRTLDFLISNFVLPTFPAVKIGRDFTLDYKIDHLEIGPGVVMVVLRGK